MSDHNHVPYAKKKTGVPKESASAEAAVLQKLLPHAFEMFSQEKETSRTGYEGSGLGLAIAKELSERLGGNIALTSQKGKGTTVRAVLPFRIGGREELALCPESKEKETVSLGCRTYDPRHAARGCGIRADFCHERQCLCGRYREQQDRRNERTPDEAAGREKASGGDPEISQKSKKIVTVRLFFFMPEI